MFLGAAILLILAVTLHPTSEPPPTAGVLCFPCGRRPFMVVALNVGLFTPFGALLAYRGWSVLGAALAGSLLSVGIETAQLWVPGRHTSVVDVLSNGTGALLGAIFARMARVEGRAGRS